METIKQNIGYFIAIAVVVIAGCVVSLGTAFAGITNETQSQVGTYKAYTFFATTTANTIAATTTTATSTDIISWFDSEGRRDAGYVVIAGAKNVNFIFQRKASGAGNANNAGSSDFKIQVAATSTDTWYDYNTLIQSTATTTADLTALRTFTLTGTTTLTVKMRDLGFYAARCVAIVATDGTNFCSATVDY